MRCSPTLSAIIAVLISTLFFSFQDVVTKQLSGNLPAWQIVSIRFFFFSIFALVYASRTIGIRRAIRSSNLKLQLLRGIIIVSEIALFAYTIGHLGLAEMHAIFACFPLLVIALSVIFLNEDVGWRRWLAVSAGFIGTIIILRPDTGVFDVYAILAMICALGMAIYTIITRKVAHTDQFETSLLYFGVVSFIFSLFFTPFVWQQPDNTQWIMLLGLSVCGIIGHFCLIKALQLAPAALLQPFNYLVLVWAIMWGYLLFGEILGGITLIGVTIVVGSGLFIAWREYKLQKNN